MIEELINLVENVYLEGCYGGITDDTWFKAYALAAVEITKGEAFTEDLVIDTYNKLKEGVI